MAKFKQLPKFKSTAEESIFWQENDTTQYLDWAQANLATLPNLKPSTETISLRLSENLLNDIKVLANKQDVPYQSLMKILLSQAVSSFKSQSH